RQSAPFTCRIDDDVQVAGARAISQSARPIPHRVPLVLFERDRTCPVTCSSPHVRQTHDIFGGLEADPHLVSVILAVDRGSVHTRAHLRSQDQPTFSEVARFFRGMWMGVPVRQGTLAANDGWNVAHSVILRARSAAISGSETHQTWPHLVANWWRW